MRNRNDDKIGPFEAIVITVTLIVSIAWVEDKLNWLIIAVVAIAAFAFLYLGTKSVLKHREKEKEKTEAKLAAEEVEKREKENASYNEYVQTLIGSDYEEKLSSANRIIIMLHNEKDEFKHYKIVTFFDRYLPLMTEIIKAGGNGITDIDDSIEKFTLTTQEFAKSLYNSEDTIDINNKVMTSLANIDGLHDSFKDDFRLDVNEEKLPETRESSQNSFTDDVKKIVYDVEIDPEGVIELDNDVINGQGENQHNDNYGTNDIEHRKTRAERIAEYEAEYERVLNLEYTGDSLREAVQFQKDKAAQLKKIRKLIKDESLLRKAIKSFNDLPGDWWPDGFD